VQNAEGIPFLNSVNPLQGQRMALPFFKLMENFHQQDAQRVVSQQASYSLLTWQGFGLLIACVEQRQL
jgi:hypothetical protein